MADTRLEHKQLVVTSAGSLGATPTSMAGKWPHSVFSFAMTTSAVPGTNMLSTKAAQTAASLDYWGSKARK